MKIRTVKRILVTFLVNHVYAGTRFWETKRKLLNSIGFEIGEGTKVVAPITCSGKLIAGENCWLGRDLKIQGNGTVIIGSNCDVAPEVTFLTGGHEIGDPDRRAGKGEIYTIHIEDGCWIGARSTFGRNTTVGRGSVIAACACVMKDVCENRLVGGVPAREIRKLND